MRRVLLTVAVLVGLVSGCGGSDGKASLDSAAPAASAGPVYVVYELGGTATGANITLTTPSGTQQASVAVPLVDKATGKPAPIVVPAPAGSPVYLSAQNSGSGTISCTIKGTGGAVIASNTSSGSYAVVTCQGTAR